jgi:hypothetical protein
LFWDRYAYSQMLRQADRQTDEQTDRQTDRVLKMSTDRYSEKVLK